MSKKTGAAALAVVAAVAVAVVTSKPSGKSKKKAKKKSSGKPKGGWADGDAPRRIREIAAQVEEATGWWGLGDFLVAVAWTESRGNSNACNVSETGYCAQNSARGWFQGRPKSFLVRELEYLQKENPDIILDERWSVALAAWYAYRLRGFKYSGQVIDWLALRRGWAYPSRVSDVDEDYERSMETRERFEDGVYKAGLDDNWMYERAFPSGFHWPGIEAVLEAVGAADPWAVSGLGFVDMPDRRIKVDDGRVLIERRAA